MTASRDGAVSQPSLRISRIDGERVDASPLGDALRALEASEDRLRGIVDAIPDLIFRCDAQGRLVDGKYAGAEDLLVPPEVFLGKRLQEVLPPPIPERFAEALARTRTTGTPESACHRGGHARSRRSVARPRPAAAGVRARRGPPRGRRGRRST